MASLIKHRGKYYVQFYDKDRRPRQKQVNLQTTKKRLARERMEALVSRQLAGEFDPWKKTPAFGSLTVEEAAERFLEDRSHLAASTQKRSKQYLDHFLSTIPEETPIENLGPYEVRHWINKGEISKVTTESRWRHLRTFFNWCIDEGLRDENPCHDVDLPRTPSKFPQYLEKYEVEEIVQAVEEHARSAYWLKELIWVAVYTAMRRGELAALTWSHVNLGKRTIVVPAETSKSDRDRMIPMVSQVHDILSERSNQRGYVFTDTKGRGPLKGDHISHTFKKYARKAGYEEISFHGLRHTACSWMAMRGCSIETIRQFAGHSSTNVTQKYMHLSSQAYHDQVRQALESM